MSNYHPVDYDNKMRESNNIENLKKQPKYVDYNYNRNDVSILYIPSMFPTTKNFQNFNTDVESYLKYPVVQSNSKGNYILDLDNRKRYWDTSMHLLQDEPPFFPNLNKNKREDGTFYYNYTNRYGKKHDIYNDCFRNITNRTNLDTSEYVRNGFKGHGRGIGDIHAESDLKFGLDTRQAQEDVSNTEFCRFEKLFRNYQNPHHVQLPWKRGGIDTRNLDKFSRKNYYIPG